MDEERRSSEADETMFHGLAILGTRAYLSLSLIIALCHQEKITRAAGAGASRAVERAVARDGAAQQHDAAHPVAMR
jgi:hypothetical protein